MNTGIIFDLYEDEEIRYVLRRHWLAFILNIFIVAGMLILFFIGLIAVSALLNSNGAGSVQISQNLGKGALIVFSSIYLLSTIGYFYIAWLDYYMDIFILTNKRIIRMEQMVLFGQKVSETSFQHIQDVSSKVQGFLHTLLGVGTVFVETAGERENFSFTNMKDPGLIAAWILETQHGLFSRRSTDGPQSDLSMEIMNQRMDDLSKKNTSSKNDSLEEAIKDTLLIPKRIIERLLKKDVPNDPDHIPVITPPNVVKQATPLSKVIPVTRKEPAYKDGRKIIPEGVIWESEQYLTVEVLNTLNSFSERDE